MKATDADDPTTANGELKYSLLQDYSVFEIHKDTGRPAALMAVILQQHCLFLSFKYVCPSAGEITCKVNTLDRETRSQYVLVVKAQDMGGIDTGSTATTSVTINVEDINDNIASFTRSKKQTL